MKTFELYTKAAKLIKAATTKKERGTVCIEADHEKNISKIDRFPINKPSEAKAALKRIKNITKSPKWWNGSVAELKDIINKKINEKYLVSDNDGLLRVKLK